MGRPYFFIHPCETANVMSHLRESESPSTASEGHHIACYLTSWLSVYGVVVGATLTSEQASQLLAASKRSDARTELEQIM